MWKYLLSKYPAWVSLNDFFQSLLQFLMVSNAQVINGQSCVYSWTILIFSVDIWNYSIYIDQMCLMDNQTYKNWTPA